MQSHIHINLHNYLNGSLVGSWAQNLLGRRVALPPSRPSTSGRALQRAQLPSGHQQESLQPTSFGLPARLNAAGEGLNIKPTVDCLRARSNSSQVQKGPLLHGFLKNDGFVIKLGFTQVGVHNRPMKTS